MIKDIMSAPVFVVSADENVARARNLMLRHKIGRLVIIKNEEPIGIVTKKDIGRRLNQAEPQWRRRPIDKIPVEFVMTEGLITIFPEALPQQAADLMIENNIHGLPVVREQKTEIIGIVTKWDLIKYYSDQKQDTKVKDLNISPVVTVHRHHTISHVLNEMEKNAVDRIIVTEGNDKPVGIITTSNIAFTEMYDQRGNLPEKDVKFTRKESYGGQKKYRYVLDVPLVAEDIMSSPLITIKEEELAVDAARLMVNERINGLPVMNDTLVGMLTYNDILKAIVAMR